MYEVIQFAGQYNQDEIARFNTYKDASKYVEENYTPNDVSFFKIDITHNGSTEF